VTVPDSALLKFARASEHLDALKREVAAFEQNSPYGVREQIDEDRTQRTFYMVEKHRLPERIGLMIGDCIHNFRCALDHLVFNLPRHARTNPRWEGTSQFPICDDHTKFAARRNDTLGVDPTTLAVMESLQPYCGGNDPVGHPLWYLRELSNFDKHRLIRFAALIPTGYAIDPPPPATGTVRAVFANGAVEHGAIIGKLYYSDPSPPGGQFNVTMSLGVTIAELEPAIGVQTALVAIQNTVEDVLTKLGRFI
jgi:hypothetical protein